MSCKVCDHPDREEIEKRIAGGESVRKIGAYYGIGHALVQRHKRCVSELATRPEAIKAAQKLLDEYVPVEELPPRPSPEASPIEMVRWLYVAAADSLERSRARGEEILSLRAHQQTRQTVELLAKLLGDLVTKHEHTVSGNVQVQGVIAHLPVTVQQLVPRAEAGDWKAQSALDRYAATGAESLPAQIATLERMLAEARAELGPPLLVEAEVIE